MTKEKEQNYCIHNYFNYLRESKRGIKMKNTYYELNEDFAEIKSIFVEEVLCKEDLEEGLEPMIFEVKVALTSHAMKRMYSTENRDIEWEEIETILLKAGDSLLSLKNGEVFNIATKDDTVAIVGNVHYQDGDFILIVHTIIRVQTKTGRYKKIIVKDTDKTLIVAV